MTGSPYIGYKFIINPPTTLSKYFLIINTDSLIDYLFKIPLNLQKSNKMKKHTLRTLKIFFLISVRENKKYFIILTT